jgi:hypothetical protein
MNRIMILDRLLQDRKINNKNRSQLNILVTRTIDYHIDSVQKVIIAKQDKKKNKTF